jgi:hypothetical protein
VRKVAAYTDALAATSRLLAWVDAVAEGTTPPYKEQMAHGVGSDIEARVYAFGGSKATHAMTQFTDTFRKCSTLEGRALIHFAKENRGSLTVHYQSLASEIRRELRAGPQPMVSRSTPKPVQPDHGQGTAG